MKAIKLIIILLTFMQLSAPAAEKLTASNTAAKIKLTSGSQKDTAVINNLIRKGTKYLSSKSSKIDMAKTYIDSAVMICEKKNIDIPARLHLLLADYHYITGDLRSASEEAAIALKRSGSEDEPDVLARTNIFLGSLTSTLVLALLSLFWISLSKGSKAARLAATISKIRAGVDVGSSAAVLKEKSLTC